MKSVSKRRPAEFIHAELKPERVARMWGAIEASQRVAPRQAWAGKAWALAGAAALAACLVLWISSTRRPSVDRKLASAGDVFVTQRRGTALGLPDGSSLALSELAQLSVIKATPSEVALHLERGRVQCDVAHDPQRPFSVEAAGIAVHVKGTQFSVEVDAQQVSVHVQRGAVEVTGTSGELLARMTPGQTWSGPIKHEASTPLEPSATPPASAVAPSASPSAVPTAPTPLDADALFERANAARIAGRAGPAAADYDRFRTRFPQDARAGLAAFELGRIRLDSLADPSRALVALRFALSHNRGGFAAEDAQALQVDALARLGDLSACRNARAAFLKAHPKSAHLARVSRACPDE